MARSTPTPAASAPRSRAATALRRLVRVTWWLAVVGALAVVFAAAMVTGMVARSDRSLARVEQSKELRRYEGELLARDGKTVLRSLRTPTSRRYLGDGAVPKLLGSAVVSTEDRRFYAHGGVDARGIARAVAVDAKHGALLEGGSTITQQLVKNAYAGKQRTAGRKLREAVLAIALDARWSKQHVLAAYLDTAYFGAGAWGVRDASARYFGHGPSRLTLPEAALLAGLLRAPGEDDPFVSPSGARAARSRALDAMERDGVISAQQAAAARTAPLPDPHRKPPAAGGTALVDPDELAPHASDEAVTQLVAALGASEALGGGIRARTTIDARMQRAAVAAASRIDGTGLSTAIVVLDPRSGEVRALALGGPAASRAFDVAAHGARQPGSAFKPFTLTAAYEAGQTPDSPVLSAPYHWPGTDYRVTNDEGYSGDTTIARATWHSDNTAFARLAHEVGLDAVFAVARAAGIRTKNDEVPPAVLGGLSRGVTPLELASAYATFADHGVHAGGSDLAPTLLLDAHGRDGTAIDLGASGDRRTQRAVPRGIADLVTQTLEGVVQQGTGTGASIGRPAAGKTGTTDDNVDAWFAGYVPNLVAVVWVGHPEGSVPMRTENAGGPVTGGSLPAAIWRDLMGRIESGRPVRDFDLQPPKLAEVLVDRETGLLVDEWCSRAVLRHVVRGVAIAHETDCPERQRAVPYVGGLTAAAAQAKLAAAGFAHVETRDDQVDDPSVDDGTVTATEPATGQLVARDDTVVLVVARQLFPQGNGDGDAAGGGTGSGAGTTRGTSTTGTTPTTSTGVGARDGSSVTPAGD